MIKDEFTDLKISAQRRYQLRMIKKGLCIKCGRKLSTKTYCELHRKYANKWHIVRYHDNKDIK